jgi:hypothetical protein
METKSKLRTPLFALLMVSFLGTFTYRAEAIFNGQLDIGDQRVLSLVKGEDNVRSACSASLISPQVVVSAAHCLGNPGFKYSSEIYEPKDLWVALPGSDLNTDDTTKRVRVLRALLTNGYDNTWDPDHGNVITQKDDIAFYLLEKPLVGKYEIPIATSDDVTLIKSNRLQITHIGYGLQSPDGADGKPYLVKLKSFTDGSSHYGKHPAKEANTVASEETGDQALCGGDSGSPWYATINNVEKLVAVTVSASGCRGAGSGLGGTMGTVIDPYLYLLEAHWNEYLKDLPDLLKANPGIDYELPLIQRSGGCDARVDATLQILKSGTWTDFMAAQGWAKVLTCPATNPYQPWVRANVTTGTQIRWNIYAKGNWSVFTDPITYVNPTDGLMKTNASPVPTPTFTPAPLQLPNSQVVRSTTQRIEATKNVARNLITCVKGKFTRKFQGKNAKCPAGYKKK